MPRRSTIWSLARAVGGQMLGAPARADLRAGIAPGRMRVPDRRAGGGGGAPDDAVGPRHDTVERATVTCLRVDLYTTLDQSDRAVDVGLDYLRHLGIDWSPHPTDEEARREYERIWSQLGSRTIEELDRSAFDERSGVPRDSRCSDQARAARIVHGRESVFPGHLPGGESQPGAWQQRRLVRRLCRAWQ